MIYLLIASYLIGSISSAVIICKALGVPDPRTQGSKNPGATNVLRLGGKKIAAFVLFFDGLKGAVPVFIGEYYGFGLIALTLTVLCALLGHIFPVFFRFKRKNTARNSSSDPWIPLYSARVSPGEFNEISKRSRARE